MITALISLMCLFQVCDATPAPKTQFKNWGLNSIEVEKAWTIEKGDDDILIAVIDTGADEMHDDFVANSFVSGMDFNTNKPSKIDVHGHGTHVTAIIAGVAKNVRFLSLTYYSDENDGTTNLANTVRAIDYAVKAGARIINYSGGGPEFSMKEYVALRKAQLAGVLLVAAAGNERSDTDQMDKTFYPSSYKLNNTISVSSLDMNNNLLASSNWGKETVTVAAPGENIYSALPGKWRGYMSGTSQATAFVTGIAALLLSKNPKLTPTDLKTIIAENVDKLPSLEGKVSSGGRVNAFKSLSSITSNDRR